MLLGTFLSWGVAGNMARTPVGEYIQLPKRTTHRTTHRTSVGRRVLASELDAKFVGFDARPQPVTAPRPHAAQAAIC